MITRVFRSLMPHHADAARAASPVGPSPVLTDGSMWSDLLSSIVEVPAFLENMPVMRGIYMSAIQHPVLHVLFHLVLAVVFTYSFSWLFWLALSILLTLLQLAYAVYEMVCISVNLSIVSTLKFWTGFWGLLVRLVRPGRDGLKGAIEKNAKSFKDFERLSTQHDALGRDTVEWRESTKDFPQAVVLEKTTEKLRTARLAGNYHDLQFLLSGLLKRDHLGITDEDLHKRCVGTKYVVEAFQLELEKCLKALVRHPKMPLNAKLAFFRTERRSLGQTALCLSGGGSICMYHMGIVKALIEAGVYKSIRCMVSGVGGG